MTDALIQTYDIYYTEPAATKKGFMLAKNKDGSKKWERYDRVGSPPLFAVADFRRDTLPKEIKDSLYGRLRLGQLFDASGVPTTIDEKYKDIIIPFGGVRLLRSLTVFSSGLSASIKFTVSYSINGGADFTSLGDFDTSPSQTISFGASVTASAVILRFLGVAVTDGQAPKLINFHLNSVSQIATVATFVHTVKCSSNLRGKKNIQTDSTIAAIATFINLMRDKVCTLGDRDGVEHSVMVRVVHEVETFDEERNLPERLYTIEATEV